MTLSYAGHSHDAQYCIDLFVACCSTLKYYGILGTLFEFVNDALMLSKVAFEKLPVIRVPNKFSAN